MSTLKEIAKAAKVSEGTVSRVLSGKIRGERGETPKKIKLILELVKKMDYRPNASARAMARQRTFNIGVVMGNTSQHLTSNLAAYIYSIGINDHLREHGYMLMHIPLELELSDASPESRAFNEQILEGLIVIGCPYHDIEERVRALAPQVLWLDGNVYREHNCIRRDEVHAGYVVATKLLERNPRSLIWCGPKSDPHYSLGKRLEGVRKACAERGATLVEPFAVYDTPCPADFPALCRGAGLVACDYLSAQKVSHALTQQRMIFGIDYFIASCDNDPNLPMKWPGLSSVMVDRLALGREAARHLLQMIEEKTPMASLTMRHDWVAGETAGELTTSAR